MPDTDADFVHDLEKLCGSAFLLGMVHAEAEKPGKHIQAADDDIPPIAFSEAVNFLKSKVPLTKAEWKALEPKLHFRAFTVAKLGDATLIESAKQQLVAALEDGASYRETWERLKTIADTDALGIKPGYWENVFRTNTQSAYIAGKLQQYEGSGAVAYQLFVIEDSRTSRFCRNLLTNGRGLIIPIDHAFWKTYGFPPYHFQCRTSIRAIYASQVGKDGLIVDNPTMKSLARFKPQEGFGGNPLEKESWWRMTRDMAIRAAQFGLWNDIEQLAKDNGLYNFAMNLVNGSDWRKLQGTSFKAEKARLANPLQKEVNLAKILTENGHSWYFTPENKSKQGLTNYDGILDGNIADMKVLTSKSLDKIAERIGECDTQKAQVACIHITNTQFYSEGDAQKVAKQVFSDSGYLIKDKSGKVLKTIKVSNVKKVCLVFGENISFIKK